MDEPPSDAPDDGSSSGDDSWLGVSATANQAMEWGINLCGQLATLHAEGVVVGRIGPGSIRRGRFGQPRLPDPDPQCTAQPWTDVAALARSIGAVAADPPPELTDALRPPYASAVTLGQELQDAQRALGLPVAPIPYEHAPAASVGGSPPEVPPAVTADASLDEAADLDFDPAELARNPNVRVLLLIVIIVAVGALAIGIGW